MKQKCKGLLKKMEKERSEVQELFKDQKNSKAAKREQERREIKGCIKKGIKTHWTVFHCWWAANQVKSVGLFHPPFLSFISLQTLLPKFVCFAK